MSNRKSIIPIDDMIRGKIPIDPHLDGASCNYIRKQRDMYLTNQKIEQANKNLPYNKLTEREILWLRRFIIQNGGP